MTVLAAEAAGRGWAHLVGLGVAAVVALLAIGTHQWWMERTAYSPTPPEGAEDDMTPGETYEPDTDDTSDEPADDTSWWGRRVQLPDGSTVVRQHALDVVEADEDDEGEESETREEMADRLVREGGSYADWVREIMGAFDVSEATAKRAIRDARDRVDA